MSSRIEPSLHEVLNYPDESRRMLMQGFADKVDRIASNNRRTDIELFQVCPGARGAERTGPAQSVR